MTFDEWLVELDAIAAKDGAKGADGKTYSQMTGEDCWRDSFDDGLSPQDAWDEELAAGR